MTDDELKSLFQALRQENALAQEETRRHFDVSNEATRHDFSETADRLSAENRNYFEIATESTREAIGLIAEKVTAVDERVTREGSDIREEMRRGFADTQAMIKFSHDELHRRVRALEETQRSVEQALADVQSRLGRLESTAQ